MAKSKQVNIEEVKIVVPPMKTDKYKPIPKFKSGCKNC